MLRETKDGPSGRPFEKAIPADVVASALKPTCSRKTAEPASHGFGNTKQPDSCKYRKSSMADVCLIEYVVVDEKNRTRSTERQRPCPPPFQTGKRSDRIYMIDFFLY